MGHSTLIPMLALNVSDLVFYGFMAMFVVGPWIAKTLKQVGSANRPQQPPLPSDAQSPTTQTTHTPRAADLARRRQEKLEALTRKRHDPPSQASGRSSPQEPGNLTMTQRVQRARAKALYEQRAQQLKQGNTPTAPKRPTIPTSASPSRIPSQPRQEIDQIRQQARAQKKQQLDAARQKANQAQIPARRHPKKITQTMRLEPVPPAHEERQVHRHVPNAPMPASRQPGPRMIKHLDTASLRQAIILKEVLDRPLALRPPAGELPNFDMNQNPY